MIDIMLIMFKDCDNCEYVKTIVYRYEGEHDVNVIEVDAQTDYGREIIQKNNITEKPAIFINGKFFAQGLVSDDQIQKKMNEIRAKKNNN